ncbi:hypothetical protein AB6A40_010947 [Gnathostoma spinigerum]|uniref:Uncharacterized protein n=1 Tax=Gnathostoma spinigerum TaxID=75299 RepID=A0ABD6F2P6_9BILA
MVESDPVRIIRECAYSEDPKLDGMRKQGNKAIKLLFYQCVSESEGTPCNGASSIFSSILTIFLCFSLFFYHG